MESDDAKNEEIQRVRRQEGMSAAKRQAADDRKRQRDFARQALKAIKSKDARSYRVMLKHAGVVEGSDEWNEAWKQFYSG